ncbi:flavin reductase family protein [Thalassolituus sp. LLYu03]|uniref:flavin reductase family protein n=1 Tax=Thalassolituus sp. LLYu03 TaxID=3421656 RepID=UPI003D2DD541
MNQSASFSEPKTMSASLWQWLAQSLTQHDRFAAYFEPLIQLVRPGWSTDSVLARVTQLRAESDDVYTLVIRPAARWAGFQAGQFLELISERDGVRSSRCFSISSSPDYFRRTGLIELSIRVQDGGRMTPWFREHFVHGGRCNLSAAQGSFVLPAGDAPLLMIAGGSGITPFRSMLQQLARAQSGRNIHLMYYARHAQAWLFRDELQRFMLEMPQLNVSFIDSEHQGFISVDHLHLYCPDAAVRTAMICGPSAMIRAARETTAAIGVADVRFEYFGAAPVDMPRSSADDAVVSFARSGKAVELSSDEPKPLLQVAEEAGLKPVSGCRIGVCHQCICKKSSGVVFNTQTGRYSDTGPEEIQLCVSVATGDLVLDL